MYTSLSVEPEADLLEPATTPFSLVEPPLEAGSFLLPHPNRNEQHMATARTNANFFFILKSSLFLFHPATSYREKCMFKYRGPFPLGRMMLFRFRGSFYSFFRRFISVLFVFLRFSKICAYLQICGRLWVCRAIIPYLRHCVNNFIFFSASFGCFYNIFSRLRRRHYPGKGYAASPLKEHG